MKKPKMIIFDYGHTLAYEHDVDFLRGTKALFEHIKTNKQNLSPEQVNDFSSKLFYELLGDARTSGLELHQWQTQRFLYEYLEVEFNLEPLKIEEILWSSSAPGALMPDADVMIDYINAGGIRSGVISNISWSGAALSKRLNGLLPLNHFEFIIASSEYVFRKPNPLLFELALKKAGLPASEVWFCGDNVRADIDAAAAVGIYPIWYEHTGITDPWSRGKNETSPRCEHLHIHEWAEFTSFIKGLEE